VNRRGAWVGRRAPADACSAIDIRESVAGAGVVREQRLRRVFRNHIESFSHRRGASRLDRSNTKSFPEVVAAQTNANESMTGSLRQARQRGLLIRAEGTLLSFKRTTTDAFVRTTGVKTYSGAL
jgi:hypothetical protein